MGIHINDLKSVTGDFARAYLFNAYISSAPVNVTGGETLTSYLVESTSLPTATLGDIDVPWQGQTYKIASTHEFEEWTCTYKVDVLSQVRKSFEEWMKLIHDPSTNIHGIPNAYFGEVKVELLSGQGIPVMTYTLHQAYPKSVGATELGQETKEVATFEVTFRYTWHESE